MAKLYKTTLYLIDANADENTITPDLVEEILIGVGLDDSDYMYEHFNDKVVNFEWSDNHILNFTNATQEDYENTINKNTIK